MSFTPFPEGGRTNPSQSSLCPGRWPSAACPLPTTSTRTYWTACTPWAASETKTNYWKTCSQMSEWLEEQKGRGWDEEEKKKNGGVVRWIRRNSAVTDGKNKSSKRTGGLCGGATMEEMGVRCLCAHRRPWLFPGSYEILWGCHFRCHRL